MSNKTIITTVIRMMAGGCGLPLNKSFSKYVLCFLSCLEFKNHQEGLHARMGVDVFLLL